MSHGNPIQAFVQIPVPLFVPYICHRYFILPIRSEIYVPTARSENTCFENSESNSDFIAICSFLLFRCWHVLDLTKIGRLGFDICEVSSMLAGLHCLKDNQTGKVLVHVCRWHDRLQDSVGFIGFSVNFEEVLRQHDLWSCTCMSTLDTTCVSLVTIRSIVDLYVSPTVSHPPQMRAHRRL
jgi:hypothetical protein